jgi:hypothetical protein
MFSSPWQERDAKISLDLAPRVPGAACREDLAVVDKYLVGIFREVQGGGESG